MPGASCWTMAPRPPGGRRPRRSRRPVPASKSRPGGNAFVLLARISAVRIVVRPTRNVATTRAAMASAMARNSAANARASCAMEHAVRSDTNAAMGSAFRSGGAVPMTSVPGANPAMVRASVSMTARIAMAVPHAWTGCARTVAVLAKIVTMVDAFTPATLARSARAISAFTPAALVISARVISAFRPATLARSARVGSASTIAVPAKSAIPTSRRASSLVRRARFARKGNVSHRARARTKAARAMPIVAVGWCVGAF